MSQNNIYFSIIMPAYNVEKTIKRALESVLLQQDGFEKYEIIVVNDGSKDNTENIVLDIAREHQQVKLYSQENQGAGAARNFGVSVARGKYILFLDPDDYVEPRILSENYKFLSENHHLNMVIYGYIIEHLNNDEIKQTRLKQLSETFLETKEEFRKYFETLINNHFCNQIWTKIYRKEYLLEHKCRFNSYKQGEDLAFNIDVYENIDNVYISPSVYYHYVRPEHETAMNTFNLEQYEVDVKINLLFEKLIDSWENTDIKQTKDKIVFNYYINTSEHFLSDGYNLSLKERFAKISQERKKRYLKESISNLSVNCFEKKLYAIDFLVCKYAGMYLFFIYLYIRKSRMNFIK